VIEDKLPHAACFAQSEDDPAGENRMKGRQKCPIRAPQMQPIRINPIAKV
jgi:hypothetical protein